MSVLVDSETRVLCQGFTGRQATFYSERAVAAGTQMVAGVTPGKGGQQHLGLPVFDSVSEARSETGADASVIFVPPAQAAGAMIEAIEAEMPLVVCITERIPVLDMIRVKSALQGTSTVLVGPNCPGIVTPGQCRIGIMPMDIFKPGRIGIVSRSSTLTYEAIVQTTDAGLGQSTCLGIGADPVHGMDFTDAVRLFLEDADTDAIVLVGEIGGDEEERVADFIRNTAIHKPVVAYVAGRHAPEGRRMGHAGAVVTGGRGSARSKIAALESAGITVASNPTVIGRVVKDALSS